MPRPRTSTVGAWSPSSSEYAGTCRTTQVSFLLFAAQRLSPRGPPPPNLPAKTYRTPSLVPPRRGGGGVQFGLRLKSSSLMLIRVKSKLTENGLNPIVTNTLMYSESSPPTLNRQIGLLATA